MIRPAALLFCLVLPAAARAEAIEPAAVTPADRSAISTCLAEAGASYRSCVGAIAVVCARQASGDRREAEIACSRRESEVWRERLDVAGRALAERLGSGPRARFLALQRSWEGYTSQKCAFTADVVEPARAPGAQAGCELTEVAQRAVEVERLARRGAAAARGDGRPRIER